MPLVKIDVIRNARTPPELRALADVVQDVLEQDFRAPKKDRYQVYFQHVYITIIA